MAWGGSLNEKGSDHIRKLRKGDKVIGFLEDFKKDLKSEEKEDISKAIEIIIDYMTKISEDNE